MLINIFWVPWYSEREFFFSFRMSLYTFRKIIYDGSKYRPFAIINAYFCIGNFYKFYIWNRGYNFFKSVVSNDSFFKVYKSLLNDSYTGENLRFETLIK